MSTTLDTKAVNVLTEVLRDHGTTLAEEYGPLSGMFSDYLKGDCQEERDLLLLGLRYGVVSPLIKAGPEYDTTVLVAMTTQFQHQTKYLTLEAAHFAVHGWAYAISTSSLPKTQAAPAPTVLGTPQQRTLFATIACCLVSVGLVFLLGNKLGTDSVAMFEEQLLPDTSTELVDENKAEQIPEAIFSPVVSPRVVAEPSRQVLLSTVSPPVVVRHPPPTAIEPPLPRMPREQVAAEETVNALLRELLREDLLLEAEKLFDDESDALESPIQGYEQTPNTRAPPSRVAKQPVPAKQPVVSIATLRHASPVDFGITYKHPLITILPAGDLIFLDGYPLLWDASTGTFRTDQRWTGEPCWVKFGANAFGMLTDRETDMFEVTMYYAYENCRLVECYTGFRDQQELFKHQWAFESLPGRSEQWYYLGKTRGSLYPEHSEYFANVGTLLRDRQHNLIRTFFDKNLPQGYFRNLKSMANKSITVAK